MIHVYWIIVSFVALCIGFKMGWEKGLDDTVEHFKNHPIPEEWIERRSK